MIRFRGDSSLDDGDGDGDTDEQWIIPSARYFYRHTLVPSGATRVRNRINVLRLALDRCNPVRNNCSSAMYLQFGVHEAKDIVRLSAYLASKQVQEKRKRIRTASN
jgi:hypothetical protein